MGRGGGTEGGKEGEGGSKESRPHPKHPPPQKIKKNQQQKSTADKSCQCHKPTS